MKIGRFLALFMLLVFLGIAFGDRGLLDNFKMRRELSVLKEENQKITKLNTELRRTVSLLKEDLSYIEKVARADLGMVKRGEIVYRFTP